VSPDPQALSARGEGRIESGLVPHRAVMGGVGRAVASSDFAGGDAVR